MWTLIKIKSPRIIYLMTFKSSSFFILLFLLVACGEEDNTTMPITAPADLPRLSINDTSISEGNEGEKTLAFTITVDGTYEGDIRMDVSTNDGSALAGIDYMPIEETMTITSPATSLEVNIPITVSYTHLTLPTICSV